MIGTLAGRLTLLWGWRRGLAAFLAGGASALAMPPLHFFLVLFMSFPVLIWLLDGASEIDGRKGPALRAAFFTGWAFGFGFFLAGLYWIGGAFLVEADVFGWALPLAVTILPAGLALFPAAACALARAVWLPGAYRLVTLALTWTIFAWLRGHILSGLPWNLVGYSLTGSPEILQIVRITGIYGLGFFTLLLVSAPALLADRAEHATIPGQRFWVFPAALIALFIIIWGSGAYRLAKAGHETVPGVALRIIQPNIRQKEKWKPENRSAILNTLLELSDRATSPRHMGVANVTHLIWPEVALPFLVLENANARAAIAALLPADTVLVTGAIRREKATPKTRERFYNDILVLDGEARLRAVYDKVHLVPFGEYLPFQKWLERIGLEQLTRLRGGFTPGRQRMSLKAGDAPPFSPLICYEIIFPGAVTGPGKRPSWIVNVTNDGWYGKTAGPYQHFHFARVRAVEEGLPVIRSANTGISAVIDPFGRVTGKLGLNLAGVIDARLPKALSPTLYALYGDWPLTLILMGFCFFIIYRYHRYQLLVHTLKS
jgi:apolipoprotein N-acyltransferase